VCQGAGVAGTGAARTVRRGKGAGAAKAVRCGKATGEVQRWQRPEWQQCKRKEHHHTDQRRQREPGPCAP
jgi:hypothetical protein